MDFPTFLLFESFFPGGYSPRRMPVDPLNPADALSLFKNSQWNSEQIFETAGLGFVELAAQNLSYALKWFGTCSREIQNEILTPIRKQLNLSGNEDLKRVRTLMSNLLPSSEQS